MALADLPEEFSIVFDDLAVTGEDNIDDQQEMLRRDFDIAEYPIDYLADGNAKMMG